MSVFQNPILPGCYPDPSICRVNDDYYLVTSTFAYFPGVPIFHSTDLIQWTQIGHVLDRPGQLKLDGLEHSQGIYAPTLRYHNGLFYLITTNVGHGGNFVVTAENPAGPWSDPCWLDAPGIDPSLFFDTDGRAYYCGTRPAPEGEKYYGNWEIYLQEFDPNRMALVGEVTPLWRGALRDVIWPEAPHIYRKDEFYYLLIAEGGTAHHHAITIARSKEIWGPYVGNPGNPVLTHRHLGRSYPIVNPGHGDLVETQNGEWWIVLLASRTCGGYYRNLGRETFLAPVLWEDGWPIISPGTGKLEWTYRAPNLPLGRPVVTAKRDDFVDAELDHVWNFIRTPTAQFWSLTERPDYLRIYLQPETINERAHPAFVGRRQQHLSFSAQAALEFTPRAEHEAAGLVVIQNNENYYRLEITKKEDQEIVRLIKREQGIEEELARAEVELRPVYLGVVARGQDYSFYFGPDDDDLEPLFEKADGRILSTDRAGGFVGTYLGMFATSNHKPSRNYADFDWFHYEDITDNQ